ncbi:TonB-dependent receptor [Mangrovitalea sediminis]|uniref:TonB-dependent receptor n=1 Tax=Mangrovitalea sediminis TaxID=1982043 RepID=UPI0013045780|nr:TonB-dependent receptor [Mangrovitalea sediminis]
MATASRNSVNRVQFGLWGSVLLIGAAMQPAWGAESSVDIGTVQATAAGSGAAAETRKVESAPYQAPSKTPLKVSQPTSVVSKHYIEHNVVATSNYDDVVKNTPSVSSVGPNGPGMMENMGLSIRGFQDGQYDITFDGMPWSDSNDFTHHSTSYFMAHDLDQASVDRGPGTAATVGTAPFGGTISLQSKAPSAVSSINPYTTFGSFGTRLFGLEYDTGVLPQYGGASGFIDYEKSQSNGYLTNSKQKRSNVFLKVTRPIGDSTSVTVAAMHNTVHQNVPVGATKAQIDQFGANYGLSSDPTQQNYYGYNYDDIHTDFEYIDLQSYLDSGWMVDNKLYTYAYYHRGYNGLDPNGETPNGTTYSATDVPGEKMGMDYRSVGDFARFARDMGAGTLNTGLWLDHQYNSRFQYLVDWTLNGALNPNSSAATERDMKDTLDNVQPYVEFAWHITPSLKLTPGVKYAWFRRTLDAAVNQKTGAPLSYSKTWSSVLPSVDLHYQIQPHWVAYAQVAKGFLAPNLNTFYTVDPSASDVKPEETMNYQLGTTWEHDRLALSSDVYYINFKNKVGHRKVGSNTIFFNEGGVVYKGFEMEATYYAGMGFSLYANGSVNDAKTKDTHQWIANTPKNTAAGGLIYNRGPWYGSLLDKFIGKRYGDDGETQALGGYSVTSMAVSYTFKSQATAWLQKARINLQLNNLFNNKSINALAGYTAQNNTPLYWTIPERNLYVTLSANF